MIDWLLDMRRISQFKYTQCARAVSSDDHERSDWRPPWVACVRWLAAARSGAFPSDQAASALGVAPALDPLVSRMPPA